MVKHQSETCETLAIAGKKILIVILLCMISVIRAEFVNSRKQTQNDWPQNSSLPQDPILSTCEVPSGCLESCCWPRV